MIQDSGKPLDGYSASSSTPTQEEAVPPYEAPDSGEYNIYRSDAEHQPLISRPVAYRRPAWVRFLYGLGGALLMWLGFLFFFHAFTNYFGRDGSRIVDPSNPHWEDFSVPSGISNRKCVHWEEGFTNKNTSLPVLQTSFPYTSTVSLSLPIDSEWLFLLARGPRTSGPVSIETSPNEKSDRVSVYVTARYFRKGYRDNILVCSISRDRDSDGVGIFTPRWFNQRDYDNQVRLETKIVFPENSSKQGSLSVKRLDTDVANSVHLVSSLEDKIDFKDFSISTSNAAVLVNSISAQAIRIDTSNGPITGRFSSTDKVILHTSNANIKVDVTLNNTHSGVVPFLDAQTSNQNLEAKIALIESGTAKSLKSEQASYRVQTKVPNGPLDVEFTDSPVDSVLRYQGQASNSPAFVKLHPAYEGTFSVTTSNGLRFVDNERHEDPSGKGRSRAVVIKDTRPERLTGEAEWVTPGRSSSHLKGSVQVVTSNNRASLEL